MNWFVKFLEQNVYWMEWRSRLKHSYSTKYCKTNMLLNEITTISVNIKVKFLYKQTTCFPLKQPGWPIKAYRSDHALTRKWPQLLFEVFYNKILRVLYRICFMAWDRIRTDKINLFYGVLKRYFSWHDHLVLTITLHLTVLLL